MNEKILKHYLNFSMYTYPGLYREALKVAHFNKHL